VDDILVSMNQVDLTRPSCIYLINATSEIYPFAMSVLFNPKRVMIQTFVVLSSYVILCSLVTEYSLSDQRHTYIP